jgi:hypothetical protein
MKKEKNEMLGVMLSQSDKDAIRKIAEKNNITLSLVARILIADSLKHIGERNVLKMVVE